MENVIGVAFVIGIIYFLYRKGVIKHFKFPIVRNNLVVKRGLNGKLTMSYKTFNGMENHFYFMTPSQTYTLNYDIKVNKGSLILKCGKGKDVLFEKEFTEDEQGVIPFTARHKRYSVLVIGNYTGGGCTVSFIPQK